MKKLILIFAFIPFLAQAQTLNITNAPIYTGNTDSVKFLGSALNLARNIYGIDIVKNRVKYADTAAMLAGYIRFASLRDSSAVLRAFANTKLTATQADALYRPIGYVPAFSEISGRPTTISGYGITDLTSLINANTNVAASVSHAANTSNPHSVTKTQLTLGNVDNTSDANKPVSTAQQTALNLKQNALTLTTTGSSGAASLVGGTLNIPQYSGGGEGGASSLDAVLEQGNISSQSATFGGVTSKSENNTNFITFDASGFAPSDIGWGMRMSAPNANNSSSADARTNNVLFLGYNPTRAYNVNEPGQHLALESYWYLANPYTGVMEPAFEAHLQIDDSLGGVLRPITVGTNRQGKWSSVGLRNTYTYFTDKSGLNNTNVMINSSSQGLSDYALTVSKDTIYKLSYPNILAGKGMAAHFTRNAVTTGGARDYTGILLSPSYQNKGIAISSFLNTSNVNDNIGIDIASFYNGSYSSLFRSNGLNVGIGDTASDYKLSVNGTGYYASDLIVNTKVGIGTTDLRAALDVNGDIINTWGNRNFGTWYSDGANYRMGFDTKTTGRVMNIHALSSENDGRISFTLGSPSSPSEVARFATTTGNFLLGQTSDDGSTRLQINGALKTEAPSSGTAAAWKLGSYITGAAVTPSTTKYVQVEIAGVAYKLAIAE